MPRPIKNNIEYFDHPVAPSRNAKIVEARFGEKGYTVFWKIRELLGSCDYHVYRASETEAWEYLISFLLVSEETLKGILELMTRIGELDSKLWHEERILWSQTFVDGLDHVWRKRGKPLPQKPDHGKDQSKAPNEELPKYSAPEATVSGEENGVSVPESPHSRVEESKEKEREREANTEIPDKTFSRSSVLQSSSVEGGKSDSTTDSNKILYGKTVMLTKNEWELLVKEYGQKKVEIAISELDRKRQMYFTEWQARKKYAYDSDFAVLDGGWPMQEAIKQAEKVKQSTGTTPANGPRSPLYDAVQARIRSGELKVK